MPKLYALYTLEARVCLVPKTFRFEVFKFSGSGIPLAAHVVFSNFESCIGSISKCVVFDPPLAGRVVFDNFEICIHSRHKRGTPSPQLILGCGRTNERCWQILLLNTES